MQPNHIRITENGDHLELCSFRYIRIVDISYTALLELVIIMRYLKKKNFFILMSDQRHLRHLDLYNSMYIDLCAIEYSLGDAPTPLKHGEEACLHIWHLK